MKSSLLRIEGVNLSNVLDDTRQLSVRRGSSLLLLNAIKEVKNKYPLTAISTGASTGLFSCETDQAEYLQNEVARYLATDPRYQYFTFVVDIISQGDVSQNDDKDFQPNINKAIALNRFRQFQQPTLAIPALNGCTDIEPCAWDNLRPGVTNIEGKAAKLAEDIRRNDGIGIAQVSRSAHLRHNFGREQKETFVKEETKYKTDFHYTHDLHEIAQGDSKHYGNLADKIAVLYFDGNKFGKLQSKSRNPGEQTVFDNAIRDKRRDFLETLVTQASKDPNFTTTVTHNGQQKENAIRLEVLLWGGDEFMLVVPAWKGMEVLQCFYRESKDWQVKIGSDEYQLTHAGGLVYCHVKTPISRICKLVEEMANHIKYQFIKNNDIDPYSPAANLYEYLSLESIDFPTQSYDDFLRASYGNNIAKRWQPQQPLSIPWSSTSNIWQDIQTKLPHRQAYRLATACHDTETFKAAYKRFKEVVGNAPEIEDRLKSLFPIFNSDTDPSLSWLHLTELWDYFAPQPGGEK